MPLSICIVMTLATAILCYLCSPNQRWLAHSLSAKPWQLLAASLILLTLMVWVRVAGALVGSVVTLTLLMLLFSLLPLTPLLWRCKEE